MVMLNFYQHIHLRKKNMIRSFYEFPLLELLQLFGVCSFIVVICLIVLSLALFVVSLLIGNADDMFEKLIELTEKHFKKLSVVFFSIIAVLFWLLLNQEVLDGDYNDLSKRVTQKQSFAVTQELYKLAAADGEINRYEHAFIKYNDEKARKILISEQKESAKRARLESTIKKIDSINPS